VSVEALPEWRKQAEIDTGEWEGLTTDERAELARLRRENRVLRMERDLLKEAAAFFARRCRSRESADAPDPFACGRCLAACTTSTSVQPDPR
jgi:transposase-like protein